MTAHQLLCSIHRPKTTGFQEIQMTKPRRVWFPLLLLIFALQPVSAATPEQDIVAIESASPLPDPAVVPGLVTGRRLMDALRNALDLVRAQVPEAARDGLEVLDRELRDLRSGQHADSPLPASYQTGGELWLPVQAEQLKVRLDAPDLRLRPEPRGAGGQIGNLPALARRTSWLSVDYSMRRIEGSLSQLDAGSSGRVRAQHLLEAALRGVRSSLILQDRPLILAYYQVEAALAGAPHWDQPFRSQLRHAAETLHETAQFADLADQLQAQADRLTPDLRGLQQLALELRKQLTAAAEATSGGASEGSTNAAGD
jgi:hypothetical protein